MISSRRAFITGLAATFAAPAIVRAANIMPVKSMPSVDVLDLLKMHMDMAYARTQLELEAMLYGSAYARFDGTRFVPIPSQNIYQFTEHAVKLVFDK